MVQSFFGSFIQCFRVPFYPYDFTKFPEIDPFIDQQEDNENKKH